MTSLIEQNEQVKPPSGGKFEKVEISNGRTCLGIYDGYADLEKVTDRLNEIIDYLNGRS